ncbi:MAG: CHASE domain-containing protein, partial [Bacteroidota bacterium]
MKSPTQVTPSGNAWKALIILIIGLAITIVATVYTKNNTEARAKSKFALVCNEIEIKISTRLHAHALILRAGSAFFAASDTVTRKDWREFFEHEKIDKNLPGIQGVGFSKVISKNQLQRHIQSIRNEGFPEYTVKPEGEREIYTTIVYLEPFTGRNLRAFGYDMFSEPVRRTAMEISRDSDIAMLSGKVQLVQETHQDMQPGALMYVPIYSNGKAENTVEQRRAAICGWVYSPFRMNDLMHGILGRWDKIQTERIHLQVYDDSISASSLLFDSQSNDTLNHNDSPARQLSVPVEFNGKKWMLYFSQPEEQLFYFDSKVIIVFIGGIVISFLLSGLFLSLINTKAKA